MPIASKQFWLRAIYKNLFPFTYKHKALLGKGTKLNSRRFLIDNMIAQNN